MFSCEFIPRLNVSWESTGNEAMHQCNTSVSVHFIRFSNSNYWFMFLNLL